MLDIKPNALEQLRVILREDFHKKVTDQELHDMAFHFVGFFDSLMKLYAERTYQNIKKQVQKNKQAAERSIKAFQKHANTI